MLYNSRFTTLLWMKLLQMRILLNSPLAKISLEFPSLIQQQNILLRFHLWQMVQSPITTQLLYSQVSFKNLCFCLVNLYLILEPLDVEEIFLEDKGTTFITVSFYKVEGDIENYITRISPTSNPDKLEIEIKVGTFNNLQNLSWLMSNLRLMRMRLQEKLL